MRHHHRLLTLPLLFLAGACADQATGTGPARLSAARGEGAEASAEAHLDLRQERAALLAADRAYSAAAASGNLVDAIVSMLAPNSVVVAPGPGFARGPAQARALLMANPNNVLSKFAWAPIRGDVSSDGTHGYTYGYGDITLPSGAVVPVKYQSYWERQPDGAWKVSAYKRVGRGPGAVRLTPPAGFETPDDKHRRHFPHTTAADAVAQARTADVAFSDLAQLENTGDAFAAFAAPDAVHSGGPVEFAFGPQEIAALFAEFPAGSFSWRPEIADAPESGDLAFTVGFVYAPNGAIAGKYYTIWQRQTDGSWLFVAD